jgi:hypothetical protein
MSTALGISAVSAVLAHELNSIYQAVPDLGSVNVSAVAPDTVQTNLGGNGTVSSQVNLFLHQVIHNGAWRNVGLPSLSTDGSRRLTNQPLALDLHYLLTVYTSVDYEAEALLGYAIQFLHENPVLVRGDIQAILSNLPASQNLSKLLAASGLADQIEMIKITPSVLGREEMAWLWTALKSDYRLTFPFQASVVLIQARNASQVPLPVATRNVAAQAGLLPAITSVVPPPGQAGACQGDSVSVMGGSLGDTVKVVLSNSQFGIRHVFDPDMVKSTSVQFTVPVDAGESPPNLPADLPAGIYLLSLQVQPPGLSTPISTNSLPFAVAPKITSGPPGSVQGPTFTLQPSCLPNVLSRQQVSLVLGTLEMAAVPFTGSTATPVFNFTNVSPGTYLVRIRVDGIDSPVAFDLSPPSAFLLQVN